MFGVEIFDTVLFYLLPQENLVFSLFMDCADTCHDWKSEYERYEVKFSGLIYK